MQEDNANVKTLLPEDQQAKLQSLVEAALAHAKQLGATAAEVGVSVNGGLSAEVRMGEVDTVEFHQSQGMGITLYQGKRKGSASTSDTSEKAVKDTVAAAYQIARYSSEDEYAGLAEADLMAKVVKDLDLYHPWTLEVDEAIAIATQCEKAALEFDERITNSEGASLSCGESIRVYGNSNGFLGGYRGSRHSCSCVCIAGQQSEMQRDYWYSAARKASKLEDFTVIGQKAAERAIRRLNPRKVPTGQYPVIFAREIASGLIGHFLGAISGGSLYRKSSFLVDSLGQAIFPDFVDIYEQPQLPGELGSAAFDGDGLETYAKHFIEKGVVSNYILGTYSARRLGMKSTANAGGVHNLRTSNSGKNLEEMCKEMGRGLIVTEVMGQGVNLVTGDYSRGASGFWVEQGEIQYPVSEITIAGNLKDLYRNIVAIGNDVDTRGHVQVGSIWLDSMMVAGQ